MSKLPNIKVSTPSKKSPSSLTGGPSTVRGVTYQVDHAVCLLLKQIYLSLADPFTSRSITMEPRTTAPSIGRWDIRIEPPEIVFEAKFNPKREELVEWLKLVQQSSAGGSTRKFRFVYAEERGAANLIQTVKRVSKIATEVSGDIAEFDKLMAHEDIKGASEVLTLLGKNAVQILQHIELEQLSDYTLDEHIELRLRYLTTPGEAMPLRNHLFEKLQRAAPTRATFDVATIIGELREKGFTLNRPEHIEVQKLSLNAYAALSVLESCKTGLPTEVLASVLGLTPDTLAVELATISQASSEDGLWSLVPLGAPLAHPHESQLRERTLRETLSYIKEHGKSPFAKRQVANVITLAEACLFTQPRLVATVFGTTDKLLKEMGKKHLVRDVALLSLLAAQRATTKERDMKLAMIRSLICGLTWYYQRVGDLEQANAAATKSLYYAREVDSKLDIAFSEKCTGRLRRIEAEGLAGSARQAKLAESVGMLSRAIETFSVAEGHGPTSPEVGDCYSLMARTYLVAGDLAAARTKLDNAFARLSDDGGKDRIDALILAGDIQVEMGRNDEGLVYYERAVLQAQSPSRDVTEMRARALLQRGRTKKLLGNEAGAAADFSKAGKIWTELEEPKLAAEAEFEELKLSVKLSDHELAVLMFEPAAVRVQAMKLHLSKLGEYKQKNTKAAGRRVELQPKYWKDLIKQAHSMVALEVI